MILRMKSSIFYALVCFFVPAFCDDSTQCWWSGCQPSNWAVRGCPSDMIENGKEICNEEKDSNRYNCCPKPPPTTSEKPYVLKDCWWSGCQPYTWAVKGCPEGRFNADEEICDDKQSSKFRCCLKTDPDPNEEPVLPPPTAIDMATCWWSGCQPTDWGVRGCPKTMVEIDSDKCGNDTNRGDMYRCCDRFIDKDDTDDITGDSCWWTSCKSRMAEWSGCSKDAVSVDQRECNDGNGDEFQCCLKVPGAKDEYIDSYNINYYKNYVRYLLLKSNGFDLVPEHLKCIDLDPTKQFIISQEDDEYGIRMCDLCPNFPLDKLSNVMINRQPLSSTSNSNFGDCFGECYERDDCVAYSFDHVENNCYLFDHTLGEFQQQDGYTSVLINQPTGLVQDWEFSRHTSISGITLKTLNIDEFFLCLNECVKTQKCTHVSYRFSSKECRLFDGINGNIGIDLEYGSVMAYNVQVIRDPNDIQWRFTEDPYTDNDEDSLKPNATTSNSVCPKPKGEGLDSIYSPKCVAGGLGCDTSTGCLTCYYPEITGSYQNDLPICPDSSVLAKDKVRSKLQSCFEECIKSTTCMAVDFSDNPISCDYVTLNSYLKDVEKSYKRYYLQYPPLNDVNKNNFPKFTLVPNQAIYKDDKSKTWFKTLTSQNWNDCLNNCLKENDCVKVSFSFSKKTCKLGSASAGVKDNRIAKNDDSQLFLRKPSLDSPFLPYKITPGWFAQNTGSKSMESFPCANDCASELPKCINSCSKRFGDWCEHISVKYSPSQITCKYYSWEDQVDVAPDSNSELYTVKFSLKTINLEALNNLTSFQLQDILTCFERNDGQTQSSLVTSDDVLDFESSPSDTRVRRKRGLWDKIKNGFKKLGKGIVDTFKGVAKDVGDTFKNAGKTIGKLVKGDFKGAKDAFLNIPIVKSGKNAVENVIKIGKNVAKGNWKEAGNAALGFASNALDFIPGPGKALKAGGQLIKNVIGQGSKQVTKDVGKKGKDKVGKDVTKNRDTNNRGKDGKPEERPHPDRCRRATKRKRPVPANNNNCNNPNKKRKDTCDSLTEKGKKVKNLLDELDCKNVKTGRSCAFECNIGYDEKPITLTCTAAKKNANPEYLQKPSCPEDPCGKGNYPLINVKIPSPLKIKDRRTRISAIVIQLDKSRKLPIWSMAYMDTMNSVKKVKREKPFFQYPCLGKQQPDNNDFLDPTLGKKDFKLIHRGHLTPANLLLFTKKAARAVNLYINVAPQDGFTNSRYWEALENQVECFTKRQRSLVVTGICASSRGKYKGGLDIPDCYWKMVCYRRPENKKETMVVAFISSNKEVKVNDQKAKDKSKEECSTPRGQSDVDALMLGTRGYVNPWLQAGKMVLVGRELGSFPLNPIECAAAKSLDKLEEDLWIKSISGGKPDNSKLNNRPKRDIPENTRGCTAEEAKRLAALLGVSSILMSDREKEDPKNGDGEDDDDDDQQGDGGNLVPAAKCNKRMIGYYPSWGKAKFTYKQAQRLTHVVYAFLEMKPDGTISVGNPDPNNSDNSDEVTATSLYRLQQMMRVAKQFAHLKVMFAVGGWENSQYFSSVASSPQSRVTFIASVIKNIEEHDFDGVDLDWEYPVTGGAHEGVPADKDNYVQLMKELRQALDQLAQEKGRGGNPYLISFAGAAGQWTLDPGFDLPGLLKYANWANVMTYDFFGAWASEWGAYTGPPAPLYFGMPKRYSGKTNVDWTMKYYTCRSLHPHQITMGVPFYGRFWRNVGDPIDPKDGMWRKAAKVNGKFDGGYAGWKEVLSKYLTNPAFQQFYHDKIQAPYLWNANEKIFLGYENQKSLKVKAQYAADKNLGGLMIWAIDQDDDDLSMLNTVFDANLCSNTDPNAVKYKCSPITEKRWWTSEDGDDFAGLCGKSAPLFKGYYPVCDPDDPGYSCCGAFGYCGSGSEYCDCPTCVNYAENPEKILQPPTKPSVPVQWYFLNAPDGKRGRCGKTPPKLNGQFPICNPDDPNGHCCSNGDYCGSGEKFCDCKECVDFKKNPNFKFKP